jgi:hypothetical protein
MTALKKGIHSLRIDLRLSLIQTTNINQPQGPQGFNHHHHLAFA